MTGCDCGGDTHNEEHSDDCAWWRLEVERLREALRVALNAMNSMGDELNALDVAGEMPDYDDNCHAFEVVRAALAGSPVETRLPVDNEAEARFEKLLAKRREKAEAWLNQGPEVSGTLAFHAEPVETRRALAERVRGRCVELAANACSEAGDSVSMQAFGWLEALLKEMRALDIDALVTDTE